MFKKKQCQGEDAPFRTGGVQISDNITGAIELIKPKHSIRVCSKDLAMIRLLKNNIGEYLWQPGHSGHGTFVNVDCFVDNECDGAYYVIELANGLCDWVKLELGILTTGSPSRSLGTVLNVEGKSESKTL